MFCFSISSTFPLQIFAFSLSCLLTTDFFIFLVCLFFFLLWLRSIIFSGSPGKKMFFTEGHSKHVRWSFKSMKCPDPQHLHWHELQHSDTHAGIPRKGEENISSIDRQEEGCRRVCLNPRSPAEFVCLFLSHVHTHLYNANLPLLTSKQLILVNSSMLGLQKLIFQHLSQIMNFFLM